MPSPNDPRPKSDSTDDGSVRLHSVLNRSPDATITYVDHWGTAGCLLVDPRKQDVLLVEQFRPVLGVTLWEIPSGRLEYGEAPGVAAKRETREETGLAVRKLESLGSVYSSVGLTNEVIHLFVATEFEDDPSVSPELISRWFSIEECVEMARSMETVDAKTALAVERAVALAIARPRPK